MSWARMDDSLRHHPKFKALARLGTPTFTGAVTLWLMMTLECAALHTDGEIDEADVLLLTRIKPARAKQLIAALINVGLVEQPREGVLVVHDFLDFNVSRAEHEVKKAANAERQRRHRQRVGNSKVGSKSVPKVVPTSDSESETRLEENQALASDVTASVTNPPIPEPIYKEDNNDDDTPCFSDPAEISSSSSSLSLVPYQPPEVAPASMENSYADLCVFINANHVKPSMRHEMKRKIQQAAPYTRDEMETALAEVRAAQGEPNAGLLAHRILANRQRRPAMRVERESYMMGMLRRGIELHEMIEADDKARGIGRYARAGGA